MNGTDAPVSDAELLRTSQFNPTMRQPSALPIRQRQTLIQSLRYATVEGVTQAAPHLRAILPYMRSAGQHGRPYHTTQGQRDAVLGRPVPIAMSSLLERQDGAGDKG